MDLKNWYREQLKNKITVLQEEKTIYSIDRDRSIESIRMTIHSLKGSGGTFGFNEITTQAKYIESLPDYDLIDQLDIFIELLENISNGNDNFRKVIIKTVLFIDEDPDLLHLMSTIFEKYDIEFLTASNYSDIKKKLNEVEHIDYIVQNMVMPNISGEALLKEIKSQDKFTATPITVLSGKDDKELKDKCLLLGAENFVRKPFNPEHFASDIVNKLNNKIISNTHEYLLPKFKLKDKFNDLVELFKEKRVVSSMAFISIGFFQLLIDKYSEKIGNEIFNDLLENFLKIKDVKDIIVKWDEGELIFLFNDVVLTNAYELLKITLDEFSRKEIFPEHFESFYPTYNASLIEINDDMNFTVALNKTEKLIEIAKEEHNRIVYDDILVKSEDTIVIVDDDSLILSMLMYKFEKNGYTVKCFDDGEQALNYIKHHTSISLIITDIKMPAMDGYQLLEILRDFPVFANIPIMMVSSMTSEDDIIKAMNLEADDFIKKPFSPDEIVARANRMIKRSKLYNVL